MSCRDSSAQSRCKWKTVDRNKRFQSAKFVSKYLIGSANSQLLQVITSYFLRVMLVFMRGVNAVFVCDQPGDEVILINQMVSDRSKLGGYGFASCDALGIVCVHIIA